MTFTQLCENSSSYEITHWIAYFKIKSEDQQREQKREEAKSRSSGEPQKKFSIFDIPEQPE